MIEQFSNTQTAPALKATSARRHIAPSTGQKEHQYLGKDTTHDVYAAGLEAINMAKKIVKKSDRKYTKCVIYADGQPAIKALAKPKQQSGQSIIKRALDNIEDAIRERPGLEFRIE
jgi:hypothetical protein